MNESTAALAIAFLSLIGTVVNVWLKLSIKTQIQGLSQTLEDRAAAKYVPRELCDERMKSHLVLINGKAA